MDDARAEYLVRQYANTILRIAYTWLGDMDDAKDICQMTLIRLLEDGRQLAAPDQERAWVIRVTINQCKDWKKSAWFRHRASLDAARSLSVEPPQHGGVLQAVDRLPAAYRQVIYLRYYEGYSVKETAEILKLAPATVATRAARAREKLKKLLGDDLFA